MHRFCKGLEFSLSYYKKFKTMNPLIFKKIIKEIALKVGGLNER